MSAACPDLAATHDIKVRVHRNLTEKTKFDANKWLAENQGAYRLFKQFTLQAIESGVTRLGAKAVAERIRWESNLRKTTDYKLNNSAISEMARRFMTDYPEYAGIFATRKHQ
jgi:membrane-bound lytic murein transglycosylase MltF